MKNRVNEKRARAAVSFARQEERVWDALVSGDSAADAAMLDDAFVGVYLDGFSGKEDHVRQLSKGPTILSYDLSQCRIIPIGADHVIFCYRADFRRVHSSGGEAMYVSSIWRRENDNWKNVFSQDTPAA